MMSRLHSSVEVFACNWNWCQKVFKDSRELLMHLESEHFNNILQVKHGDWEIWLKAQTGQDDGTDSLLAGIPTQSSSSLSLPTNLPQSGEMEHSDSPPQTPPHPSSSHKRSFSEFVAQSSPMTPSPVPSLDPSPPLSSKVASVIYPVGRPRASPSPLANLSQSIAIDKRPGNHSSSSSGEERQVYAQDAKMRHSSSRDSSQSARDVETQLTAATSEHIHAPPDNVASRRSSPAHYSGPPPRQKTPLFLPSPSLASGSLPPAGSSQDIPKNLSSLEMEPKLNYPESEPEPEPEPAPEPAPPRRRSSRARSKAPSPIPVPIATTTINGRTLRPRSTSVAASERPQPVRTRTPASRAASEGPESRAVSKKRLKTQTKVSVEPVSAIAALGGHISEEDEDALPNTQSQTQMQHSTDIPRFRSGSLLLNGSGRNAPFRSAGPRVSTILEESSHGSTRGFRSGSLLIVSQSTKAQERNHHSPPSQTPKKSPIPTGNSAGTVLGIRSGSIVIHRPAKLPIQPIHHDDGSQSQTQDEPQSHTQSPPSQSQDRHGWTGRLFEYGQGFTQMPLQTQAPYWSQSESQSQ